MKTRRYSLPSERPVLGSAETNLLRTGFPLLVVLAVPPLAGYLWRGFVFGDWGWGVVGFLICAGFTWAVWHGLLTRTTQSNRCVYHRYERPVRYWLTMAAWFAAYALSVAAFFFAHTPANAPIHR